MKWLFRFAVDQVLNFVLQAESQIKLKQLADEFQQFVLIENGLFSLVFSGT